MYFPFALRLQNNLLIGRAVKLKEEKKLSFSQQVAIKHAMTGYSVYQTGKQSALSSFLSYIPGTHYFNVRVECAKRLANARLQLDTADQSSYVSIKINNPYNRFPGSGKTDRTEKPIMPKHHNSPINANRKPVKVINEDREDLRYWASFSI
jgi:hypothetical protein